MASPPFNLDTTDPADNSVVSQFPANERSFRDEVNSYIGVEHDISTGFHKFQLLTTTQRNSLSSPPTGMRIYNTTIGGEQVNIGTSASPSWMTVGDITGAVKDFAGSTAPDGWVVCDGSAISRTTFATLFGIIGTTYGAGDGSTTFNVPDCRGRAGIGAGQGSGLTNRVLGSTTGAETTTITQANLPNVNFTGSTGTGTTGAGTVNSGSWDNGVTRSYFVGSVANPGGTLSIPGLSIPSLSVSVSSGGSGTAANNMQPSIALTKIIKT